MNPKLLVVGYGNVLRRDDGVGIAVAEEVARWNHPHVEVTMLHQLVPELVETLVLFDEVIFVDASVESDRLEWKPVEPASLFTAGHTSHPGWLLSLCDQIHGRHPQGYQLAIPIHDLRHGHRLSPLAQEGKQDALSLLKVRLRDHRECPCTR